MHELPILRDVVSVALKFAAQAEAERVVSVTLEVGELRDLHDEWMQRYFNFVTAGTVAQGAELVVRRSKALFMCRPCMATFTFDVHSRSGVECPTCASREVELTTGNELRIESIDVI